jgi:hypothetical protein
VAAGAGEAVLGAPSSVGGPSGGGQWRAGRWAARAGGATAKRSTSGCGGDSTKRASAGSLGAWQRRDEADAGRREGHDASSTEYLWRTTHGFAVVRRVSECDRAGGAQRGPAAEGEHEGPAAGAMEAEGAQIMGTLGRGIAGWHKGLET